LGPAKSHSPPHNVEHGVQRDEAIAEVDLIRRSEAVAVAVTLADDKAAEVVVGDLAVRGHEDDAGPVGKDAGARQGGRVDEALVDSEEGLVAGSADPRGPAPVAGPDVRNGRRRGVPQRLLVAQRPPALFKRALA